LSVIRICLFTSSLDPGWQSPNKINPLTSLVHTYKKKGV
jgi:hypothetical protein